MAQVWERMQCDGRMLILALALADIADDSGDRIYPSVALLAHKTRQSERQVQRELKKFRELTWLQAKKIGTGRGHTTRYRINPAWIKGDSLTPFPDRELRERVTPQVERVTGQVVKGDTAMSPDPSLSTSNPKKRARVTPKDSRAEDETRKRRIRDRIHALRLSAAARDVNLIATLTDTTPEEVRRELETLQ